MRRITSLIAIFFFLASSVIPTAADVRFTGHAASRGGYNSSPESNWFPARHPTSLSPNRHVLGYYTEDYAGDEASYSSLKTYGSQIDSIATFTYRADGNGNIHGSPSRRGNELALEQGIVPLALIHNFRDGGFNADDAHALLTVPENRQRLIRNMTAALKQEGFKGVNIDLENIPYSDRDCYTALVREFSEVLRPQGLLTTVSIPPKTGDAPTANWSGAFDYAAIGTYADWVQIMTYDEHWSGGSPGPIASLPWVESVIRYAVTQIPREKVLLGIAAYGYDWSPNRTRAVTCRTVGALYRANNTQPQYDIASGESFFYYCLNGVEHEVWYEDAEAVRQKLDLVNQYGLMGIGIWRLGFEDAAFWQAVGEKLQRGAG